MMRDDKPGPSNQKRPKESDYEADEKYSDARLHPNLKRPKHYVIVSDMEEEPSEPEDDRNQDPDYNPFFDEPLFRDLKKTHKKVARGPSVKKEESIVSNAEEKPLKRIGQPFKEVNEDVGFVEDDWYELRGADSLRYHYS